MKTLTDLEICKKIAEIEGLTLCDEWDCCSDNWDGVLIGKGDGDLKPYNPLITRALLWDLMVKYDVTVTYRIGYKNVYIADADVMLCYDDKSEIPRAVLLAIIEANNNG